MKYQIGVGVRHHDWRLLKRTLWTIVIVAIALILWDCTFNYCKLTIEILFNATERH